MRLLSRCRAILSSSPLPQSRALVALFCAAVAGPLAAQNPRFSIFGAGCAGSMASSQLTLATPPATGNTMRVDATNLPLDAAVMMTGFSRTVSPFGALPLALAGYGMPGCVAHVSPDVTVFLLGAGNQAAFVWAIPAGTALVGLRFFQQALVPDPAAGNAAGAVISAAAEVVVGLPGWPVGGLPLPDMAPIAAGSFAMGSNAGPPDFVAPYFPAPAERPVHQVAISSPFWMGRHEVTQAEYVAVMNANPSHFSGSPQLPVERVSWIDAMAYCAALTAQEAAAGRLPPGYQYRLPTEAEWEYCCRAGTTTEYHYGTDLLCPDANFALSHHSNLSCGSTGTVPVGSYAPNAWGLYDMHGNVREWCLDAWDGSANYPLAAVVDPYVSPGNTKTMRGGSWGTFSNVCRSANRAGTVLTQVLDTIGFRVVLATSLVP